VGTFSSASFQATTLTASGGPWLAVAASSGVILAAVYLLWMVKRVFFGPLRNPANQELSDLNGREKLIYAPLVALVVVMGVFPGWFLDRISPSVTQVVAHVRTHARLPVTTAALGGGEAPRPAAVPGANAIPRLKRLPDMPFRLPELPRALPRPQPVDRGP
jgi:formate hydrogenlyase subunit 3/multisubunit Na+/H+ antiporter MnhD subunit